MVGFGAGVTLEDAPASLERLTVAEMEPEVIRANLSVAERRRDDPLRDPRLRLYRGDARTALRLSREGYDAIISQPVE